MRATLRVTEEDYIREYNRRESKRQIKQNTEHENCTVQRIFGIVLLVGGVLAPVILWDATFSLFALPLGVYLILTREKVMTF